MKLSDAIDMTLRRTGMSITNTDYKTQARNYLNTIANRIVGRAEWWWLHKTATLTTTHTLTVTSISGTITAGNTISDGTKTGTVAASYDATNAPTLVFYHSPTTTGDFSGALSESGGATALTVSDAVTRQYQLASDVQVPYSFTDETNGCSILFKGWDYLDARDPDRDNTGNAEVVTVEGLAAGTGYITVAMFPLHNTTNETIRYRYLSYIPDWTDANDDDDLDIYMPQLLQPALYFGAAELYMQEKGDSEGAGDNRSEYDAIIDVGLKTNLRVWGNRTWRRKGDENVGPEGFEFFVQEGSLSA
tara:strand:+ start:10185 stop:11096 length:912 start_codon:yes stop_codon:yes gene_type:complete